MSESLKPQQSSKWVSAMPSSWALWFIRSTKAASLPAICSATATLASLPEDTAMHLIMVSRVCTSPAARYTWEPPMELAYSLVVTWSVRLTFPLSMASKVRSSVMIFVMLAGLRRSAAFCS